MPLSNPDRRRPEPIPEQAPPPASLEQAQDRVNIPGPEFFLQILNEAPLGYWQRPHRGNIINDIHRHIVMTPLTDTDRDWQPQRGQFALEILKLLRDRITIIGPEVGSVRFRKSIHDITNQFKLNLDNDIATVATEIEEKDEAIDEKFLKNRSFSFQGEAKTPINLNLSAAGCFLHYKSDSLIRAELKNQRPDLSSLIYINPTQETTIKLFESLIDNLPGRGFATGISVVHRADETTRDHYKQGNVRWQSAIIASVPKPATDQALAIVSQCWRDTGAVIAGPVPPLTTETGPGISLASREGIRTSETSFEQHRAGILLQAFEQFMRQVDSNIIKGYSQGRDNPIWQEFINQPANLKPLESIISNLLAHQGLSDSNISFPRPIRPARR